ncbi:MAG: YbbR-like domain-containing protein [Acidobacteria bacterium]|nr:YbbR-like domain-containing protein [Acidobacteriota bacterium]
MNWLRKCFTENVGLKLLSVALAVLIWAAAGESPVTEVIFQVPVEFNRVPPNTEIVPEQPSVQLRVRGPSRIVRQTTAADFSVPVDVSTPDQTGERTYPLDPENIQTPDFIRIVQIIPPQVRLRVEPTMEKQVPVQPRFSGEIAAGYRVKEFRAEPPQVTIAGPRSRVESVAAAWTDPVEWTDFSEDKNVVTTVYVPDPWVRLVESPTVTVFAEFEKVSSPVAPKTGKPAR